MQNSLSRALEMRMRKNSCIFERAICSERTGNMRTSMCGMYE